ncbi:MAG: family 16 glycoside hydrolase [Ktedonobacteraceae bacterium]
MAIKKNKTKVTVRFALLCVLIIIISGSVFYLRQGSARKIAGQTITPTVPTATPTLTGTAQTLPLFFDDFVGSNKGWSLTSVFGYTRKIENGDLTLAAENHQILTESLPTGATFNDFMVTATFTLVQASHDDSVGLYLRGDSYLDHDYRVDIYGNNTYAISKEFLDESKIPQGQFLITPTTTTALHPVGHQNSITVIMQGPKMVLLINSTMVNSVTDTDYSSGQIALFVQNSATSNGVEASFSTIAVYPAPKPQP